MLKEARIVMPLISDVSTSGSAHNILRRSLVEAFGGLTATRGTSDCISDTNKLINDDVIIYDVALEADRDATWDKLFQIAMKAGRELGLPSVYIRYPDGTVYIEAVNSREGLGGLTPPFSLVGVKDAPGIAEAAQQVPLGGRRMPMVGEIWETSCGDKVAVVRRFDRVIGKLDVVVLANGPTSPFGAGTAYEVDEDGKVLPDKSSHPRDLKRFVKDF